MPTMTAEIKSKVEELETLRVRARTIMKEFEGKGLPPEQDKAVTLLLEKAGELKTQIETLQGAEEKKTDLENLDRFLHEPIQKIRHGINGDDDDRKALMGSGWEIKAGIVYAPTSLGKPQAMFGEEVLFGDIPTDDKDAAEYFAKTRAIFAPEYKAVYSKYLRLSVKTRSESMAYTMLSPSEQKALSEGSDTAGGFLVPPDLQAEILVRKAQTGVMRQLATVRTTSRDRVEFPAVAPNTTSSTASIYSSGFVGSWVGETTGGNDVDPAFQMFSVNIRKIRVQTKLSNDFVADAASNVLSFMAQDGARNMALVEDNGFLTGNGGPTQPMGLLNSGLTTVDVEGSTTDTISNTTSSTGSGPKIISMAYQLPAQYVSNARWLMRRTIEGKVAGLVDANGRPLWAPNAGSAFGQVPMMIQGSPVVNSDWMPDDGTNANKVLLYGDFSNYIIAERAQITSVVLRERYADNDQVGIILFERVGGGCWNTDSFRVGIV